MSEPLAAIHVEVRQPDYLPARKLIHEWEKSRGVLKDAVRCPECASSRVEFPQITRKFLSPVVQVAFMALHLMPREFYCMDCQFTWPKDKPVEPITTSSAGRSGRTSGIRTSGIKSQPTGAEENRLNETLREIKRCNEQRSPETEVAVFLSD